MLVLVVDDTDSARDIAQRILRFYGVESVGARSGAEAFTMLNDIDPDLILLDVSMPEMDGFGVLAQLRQDTRWREIPVVMLTAMADKESVKRAMKLGASEYLVKSQFTAPRMLEVVNQYARHGSGSSSQ